MGTVYCIKYGVPVMNDGGVIINVSSLAAHISLPEYGPLQRIQGGGGRRPPAAAAIETR